MNQENRQFEAPSEGRQQTRTHLFVAATLYSDGGSTPVHIRNMSKSGALIESAELPDVGERIRLRRGQLDTTGWVAWRAERKAGVRLDTAVHVSDWMSRQVSAGQERVDTLVSMVRSDDRQATVAIPDMAGRMSIEAELRQLRLELVAMEAQLLRDVIMVATHPEIQAIDISVQRVDRILKTLRAEG